MVGTSGALHPCMNIGQDAQWQTEITVVPAKNTLTCDLCITKVWLQLSHESMQEWRASAGVTEAELTQYLTQYHRCSLSRLPKINTNFLQHLAAKGALQACLLHTFISVSLLFVTEHAIL